MTYYHEQGVDLWTHAIKGIQGPGIGILCREDGEFVNHLLICQIGLVRSWEKQEWKKDELETLLKIVWKVGWENENSRSGGLCHD